MAGSKNSVKPDDETFVTPEEAAQKDAADEQKTGGQKKGAGQVARPVSDNRFKRFFAAYWAKKKWTIPVTIAGLLLVLFAIPFTRYAILGLFIKGDVAITVVDSKTNSPVSSAAVTLQGSSFKTDANGKAGGQAKLGSGTLQVSKQYYQNSEQPVTVTMSKSKNEYKVSLVATGRQVPVTVTNKLTGKPLAGAVLVAANTEAKTDKNGKATIVLPTTATTQKAKITLNGYNTQEAAITVTDATIPANAFVLVPAGKLYFLSNQTGKIDVVKANLDGSDRQTVLAGTGSEDPNDTSLLASRDWKYLALLSRRAGTNPSVYLINTATGESKPMDEGDAAFTLVGWSDHTFVFQANRNGYQNWQPKAQALKSYNAETGKLTTVDETTAEGSSQYDYGFTNFTGIYILKNELVYAKNWYSSYYTNHLNGKSADLVSVHPDGSAKKTVKSFAIPDGQQYYAVNLSLYEPYGVYVQVPKGNNAGNTYYEYENGALTAKPDVTDETFSKPYPTYIISPSGKYTLWTDERDGKNVLFVGDEDGEHPRQIASLSEYYQYGWYTDDYLLVSKDDSELYILPADGSTAPQKITDYYKPPISYRGYGGGYGGY